MSSTDLLNNVMEAVQNTDETDGADLQYLQDQVEARLSELQEVCNINYAIVFHTYTIVRTYI